MYEFTTRSRRAEKQFYALLEKYPESKQKLTSLVNNPRKAIGAHKLQGKLEGKWSCKIAADARIVYEIDDKNNQLVVVAAGNHKKAYT